MTETENYSCDNSMLFILYRYGLLGASGCGKTTLLSCIVGVKFLNAGKITVLGGTPGKKGNSNVDFNYV